MKLTNDFLEIVFDDNNGSIIAFSNPKTKDQWLGNPEYARLFHLFIPDESCWISQHIDSHENQAEITACGDTVTVLFKGLYAPYKRFLSIDVKVTVTLPRDSDEALFTIDVTNNSSLPILEVWFPWFGGFETDPEHDKDFAQIGYLTPKAIRAVKRYDGYNLLKSNVRSAYIGYLPFLDISGNGKGLSNNFYVKSKPRVPQLYLCGMNTGWDECVAGWSWVHKGAINPGGSYRSDPIGLAVHDGDMHKTLYRFRDFLAGWWKAPEVPAHFHEVVGLQVAQFRDFEGRYLRPMSDLVALCKLGLDIGLRDFSLWDMMFNIYLRAGDGWFMEDSEKNRVAEMKKAVDTVKEMGCFVNTLVNYRILSKKSARYRELSDKWRLESYYGANVVESVPYRSATAFLHTPEYEEGCHPLCQLDKDYQNWAAALFKEVIEKTSINSMFVDQTFGLYHCYSKNHGHEPGADEHEGAIQWVNKARSMLTKEQCAYIFGETPDVFNSQAVELWWVWAWNSLCDVNVFRTVLPKSLQTYVIDVKEHSHEVNKAFSYGMLMSINVAALTGDLRDEPDFCQRIKRLSQLKGKLKDYVRYDNFIGHQKIELSGNLEVVANLYSDGVKSAVILGEIGRRPKAGRLTLSIRKSEQGAAEKAVLHSEYGTETPLTAEVLDDCFVYEFDLTAGEAAILVF